MGKKKLAVALIGTAGIVTVIAMKMQKKRKEVEIKMGSENEKSDEFSEELIQEALKSYFAMYSEVELAIAGWSDLPKEEIAEQMAAEYAPEVYAYMKKYKKQPLHLEGVKREEVVGQPLEITEGEGVCISREISECFFSNYAVENYIELWLFDTGKFAQIRYIRYEGEDGITEYRYLEKYISEEDMPDLFIEDMVDSLNSMLSENMNS